MNTKSIFKACFIFLVIFATPVFAQTILATDGSGFGYNLLAQQLSQAETAEMQTLLKKATTLLPPSLMKRVGRAVNVELMNSTNFEGRVDLNGKNIQLQYSLLTSAVKGESSPEYPHGTAELELLATILHESTHVYDNQLSQKQLRARERCEDSLTADSQECFDANSTQFFLSNRASFLSVAGWYGNEFKMTAREPDPYEATAPKETLAVNMEYFLLDPQFACRKPTLARYLRDHFQFNPFPNVTCFQEQTAINPEGTTAAQLLISIPWAQVYEADYLLASSGDQLDSFMGHTMIRLVICAPGHALSDACRKDISYHLVLSFRGSVTDIQESAWKGLTGQYPSRLFVLSLPEVISEYNESELRNLTAYPLKLNRTQLENLLARAMEYHWNYRGQYYFINGNCATEALSLLRSSLLQANGKDQLTPNLLAADAITPKGVLSQLASMGLVDAKPTSLDPESGMYFPSYEQNYTIALAKISQASGLNIQLKDWLNSTANSRRQVYNGIDWSKVTPATKMTVDAAFFLLETSISKIVENQDANLVAQKIENMSVNKDASATNELLDSRNELINPGSFVKGPGQYGLPTDAEIQQGLQNLDTVANEQGQSVNAIESSIQSLLDPAAWTELSDVRLDVQFYLQQMQMDLKKGGNP